MSDASKPDLLLNTDRQKLIDTLGTMSVSELAELLVMSLDAQAAATQNMKQLTEMLAVADGKIRELDSINKSQEAELLTLRSRIL
jgi:hypothetical protein